MNLILGTANFNRPYGMAMDRQTCLNVLNRAEALGIRTIATAFDYGVEIADEYGWVDRIHKYEPEHITWRGRYGMTVDSMPCFMGELLMGPFNPLNYEFRACVSSENFIARSIFCGGKLQRSHPEDVARLVFGFLKSHDVKNAVFGVESIEELELIVRVANEK